MPHFERPGIMVPCFVQILNIQFSKFALQTFKIRASDLRNSRFKASKFALEGLTHEPNNSI